MLSVLKANFATPEGEKVRARLINRFRNTVTISTEVDNISAELLRHYCKEVEKYQNPRGGYFTPGSYTVFCSRPVGIGGWRDARRSFCRGTTGRQAACHLCWARTHKGQQRY
ncbi:pyruvate formate lyase family protein [Escherichia coli]